jgi:hypothetical protein
MEISTLEGGTEMSVMRTLIWSEWRRQRKTALLLLVSTVLLYLFMLGMVLLKTFVKEIEMTAVALVIGLPFLYCIALGGSFANEFIDKSKSFLLGLPVSKTKIYFAKYRSSLLLFLLISIAGSLLMYTLTDLTQGKAFFDDLGMWTRSTAMVALLIIWILSHTTVFLYNLISRNTSSGIIALLTLPIIFVIVSFATSSVTMFYFYDDKTWIIAYILLSSLIIYIFMIGFGWFLWNKRISRELKSLKPISIAIIALFIVSAILYSINYMYTKYQYESALIEAKQNGLELEIIRKPQPTKIPDALNGMSDLMQFRKDEKELLKNESHEKISKMFQCPQHTGWLNSSCKCYMTLAKQKKVASYILNNPGMQKLYLTIRKALSKPEIQYIIQYRNDNSIKKWSNYYNHISAIERAIYLLLDRAYAQAYFCKDEVFFKSFNQAKKLFNVIEKMQFDNHYTKSRVIKDIYNTIIKAGPEGHAYTNNYIDMLNVIKNDKIYNPPYLFSISEYFSYYKKMPDMYRNEPILNAGMATCGASRLRQSLAYWIKGKIEYNSIYLEAERTNNIKKIIKDYSLLYKYPTKSFGPFKMYYMGMLHYFIQRSKIAGDKVCLALKIYRCRYGKYPEKLEELCPEILKEVPLEPRTETPYIYKREGKGFILYGEQDKVLGASINPEYYSKTYYMKYQPWNPQGKEKRK